MAKKVKQVEKKKRSNRAGCGCISLIVVLFLFGVAVTGGRGNNTRVVATEAGVEALIPAEGTAERVAVEEVVITAVATEEMVATEGVITEEAVATEEVADGRFYAQTEVEIYSCPDADCVVMGQLVRGQGIVPIRYEGDFVVVAARGGEGYVLAELVAASTPGAATAIPTRVPTDVPTVVPTLPPAQPATARPANPTSRPAAQPNVSIRPAGGWTCGGDIYNCDSFRSQSDMLDYFRTCAGDPSGLDGGGVPGVPCENESYPYR